MKKLLYILSLVAMFAACSSEDDKSFTPADHSGVHQWTTSVKIGVDSSDVDNKKDVYATVPTRELSVEGTTAILKFYTYKVVPVADAHDQVDLYVVETRDGVVRQSAVDELVVEFQSSCKGGNPSSERYVGKSFHGTEFASSSKVDNLTKSECSEVIPD
ncbi:hypothetical protein [Flammeovirga aprica]|uniref:Lipoprotein n=1 Tax=Flammeovirga aprica JL-4 TaxID=694437 RepID=A0A7X9P0J8_9BACT|nr:hypothetical protein [Flammeovirga aprica]NME67329.1 hypothetical protein [Flammeovirga aprica JL-4]